MTSTSLWSIKSREAASALVYPTTEHNRVSKMRLGDDGAEAIAKYKENNKLKRIAKKSKRVMKVKGTLILMNALF